MKLSVSFSLTEVIFDAKVNKIYHRKAKNSSDGVPLKRIGGGGIAEKHVHGTPFILCQNVLIKVLVGSRSNREVIITEKFIFLKV